ncbi:MAG: TRAP-type C4-dicarboxylate transport system substrate-binding protein, partial [Motiliproteus sp.]
HAFWVVNKSWLEDLPAQDRNKLLAASETTMTKIWNEAEAIDAGFLEQIRNSGINVVELSAADMANAKEILYAKEWPFLEKSVGPEIMDRMRKIAGID